MIGRSEFKSTTQLIIEETKPGSSQPSVSHESKDEVKHSADPVHFPRGVAQLVLGYLNRETSSPQPDDNKSEKKSAESGESFWFFDKNFYESIRTETSVVANLILRGEEKDVEEALKLIQKHPDLLHCQTIATDHLGRKVKGTPLQIAAMAGDVDLQSEIEEEKNRGLVERLAKAGKLSAEEVAEQLEVITSIKAKQSNEERNEKIGKAIEKFGNDIIVEAKKYEGKDFKELQNRCKPIIDELEKALTLNPDDITTSGFIFDPAILYQAAKWFGDNVKRFDGWYSNQSDIFWVNGFGKLQSKLSSRDAQVVRAGIGRLVNDNQFPDRSLNNTDGSSHFVSSLSRLGRDFYLGYWGDMRIVGGDTRGLGILMSSKNNSIAKLMQRPASSKQSKCLKM